MDENMKLIVAAVYRTGGGSCAADVYREMQKMAPARDLPSLFYTYENLEQLARDDYITASRSDDGKLRHGIKEAGIPIANQWHEDRGQVFSLAG